MVVRSLVVKSINVPELSSREIEKQNTELIDCLRKDDVEKYYLTAKEIVCGVMDQYLQENADKNKSDALRSAEFCKSVNKKTQLWIADNCYNKK